MEKSMVSLYLNAAFTAQEDKLFRPELTTARKAELPLLRSEKRKLNDYLDY
jgi:hypothetical protein